LSTFRFLPEQTKIIGYGRSPKPIEDLHQKIGEHVPGTDEEKQKFLKTVCPSRSFASFGVMHAEMLGSCCSTATQLNASQPLHVA
jgi:hypothetical protein